VKLTYTVVLVKEKDGRYSVSVPALKGCHTWGDTLPEALQMAEEVILLYVESLTERGLPVPPDNPEVSVSMREAAEACVYKLTVEERAEVA